MLLIKNGKIITMNGDNIEKGYVLVNKDTGKIEEVGNNSYEVEKKYQLKHLEVINADGCYVLPGLIEPHCHIGIFNDGESDTGSDGNEWTDPITPQLRAIDGIYYRDKSFTEAREAGITTVAVGPGSANVISGQFAALKTYGRTIEEMIIREPLAMKIAFGENPKAVYGKSKKMPCTRMAVAGMLRETLYKAKTYYEKRYLAEDEDKNKPDYDFKMEALCKVLKREIPIKVHAHREDDILTAIRIAKEFNLRYTIEHCTEGHLISDILAKENSVVCVGPLMTERSKPELRNLDIKNVTSLYNAGVKFAITTDAPVIPIQYLITCAAYCEKEGLPTEEALKAITINSAYAIGLEERVGSIEKGKDADIVIFDGNPLEIKTKVLFTIINGKVVYEKE